jgi:hypothetical protein
MVITMRPSRRNPKNPQLPNTFDPARDPPTAREARHAGFTLRSG